MMKKAINKAIAIVLAFLMSQCLAYAETDYRDAFSFCELYTQRRLDFENSTGAKIADISDYYYNDFNAPFGEASCSAGSLKLNYDKRTISEFMTEIYASYGRDSTHRIMSAIIAISCLEYGIIDEPVLKVIEKTNPINKAFSIYTDYMSMYTSANGIKKLDKDNPVKVYGAIIRIIWITIAHQTTSRSFT